MKICEALTVLGGSGTGKSPWTHYEPCKHPAKFEVKHFSGQTSEVCGYHVRQYVRWNDSRERMAILLKSEPTSLNLIREIS